MDKDEALKIIEMVNERLRTKLADDHKKGSKIELYDFETKKVIKKYGSIQQAVRDLKIGTETINKNLKMKEEEIREYLKVKKKSKPHKGREDNVFAKGYCLRYSNESED